MFRKNYFPDFMIIGAQKSGTSTLHFLLCQHPDLVGSNPKEIHHFDRLPGERESLDWYKSHFSRHVFESKKLFFESTPNYIYHAHIPAELFALNPSLKFIVMLRNPVTRCFSAWNMYKIMFYEYRKGMPPRVAENGGVFQYLFKERDEFPSLEECLKIELDLMKQDQTLEPSMLRRGLYHDQLVNYFKTFPSDSFFIIESNEFRHSKHEYLDQITSFLGTTPFNRNKLNTKDQHVRKYTDTMQDETRSFLNEFYKEPNEKLYNLLGVRFNW